MTSIERRIGSVASIFLGILTMVACLSPVSQANIDGLKASVRGGFLMPTEVFVGLLFFTYGFVGLIRDKRAK
jgi:hypothetical protein